jgi:hypothetical protein
MLQEKIVNREELMMKRALRISLVFAMVCAVSMTAAGVSMAQQGKVIELTYASPVGPDHTFSVVDRRWMEKIEKETNGRVKIKPFWGGTLVGSRDAIDEMAQGVADIGFVSPGYAKSGYNLELRDGLPTHLAQTCPQTLGHERHADKDDCRPHLGACFVRRGRHEHADPGDIH